ncbi:hypothetical protein DLAC_11069 [Tieghemostelium lacteum]|uniref:MRH domain-containing protein n=1 Tax=Tieghemostelium lacteum TaxID=361077 RepID=A0A151Z347_TIELA|nr:hypothetical protein DLAC_11069 [Tieghemostelium lacteum]|eukprot:KYQ88371.1 hypothetical protein DLAC_11069 [Tieghemostelium lacteum]
MKRNIFNCLLSIIGILSVVSAQGSLSQCSFKGVDYARMTANYSTTMNEYSYTSKDTTYIYNICDVAPTCVTQTGGLAGASSCQIAGSTLRVTGMLNAGTFNKLTQGTGAQITYGHGLQCANRQPRQTNIQMQCAEGQPTIIQSALEISVCNYQIVMSSKYACLPPQKNHLKCKSDSSTGMVQVENLSSSVAAIQCLGSGDIFCYNNNQNCKSFDSTSQIECQFLNKVTCSTTNTVTCSSGNFTCGV